MNSTHLTYLLLAFVFNSCNFSTIANFEIKNESEEVIDSIRIQTSTEGNQNYIQLEPGETKKYSLDMTNTPTVDGNYSLSFKSNSLHRLYKFGYFTNGYPSEKLTKVVIQKDTVLIDQIFTKNED